MQDVFQKIIEKLEEERDQSYADFDRYVNEYSPYLDSEYDDFFHKGLERASSLVKQIAGEHKDGWIPCSERLPEITIETFDGLFTSEIVLVTKVNDDGHIETSVDFLIGNTWACSMKSERVIAWQPLPKPYQPKNVDGEQEE